MKVAIAALLLSAAGALAACNGSPVNDQPAASLAPLPAATPPDTTRAARTRRTVPFVPQTKLGRVLGNTTPSPPASRSR
ncbi:hypothetical protein MUN81_14515 [Hymenobacter sp. 5317J-9]|uniref:hypothetical protein n=1 Tax=Hymenobacter sp. 5317J-9 TaxID=2932250 RepID=UPI001FD6957D|nr:hypothetical protein [Hymenobacter sp. 5317J-9]UOQ96453.1 hypothetical protein MUN81_14515 [Hymenobacter sp. 5317J-9]